MCEHTKQATTSSSNNFLENSFSRRSFFRGMAAVTGTVVWASAGALVLVRRRIQVPAREALRSVAVWRI